MHPSMDPSTRTTVGTEIRWGVAALLWMLLVAVAGFALLISYWRAL